MKLIGFNFKKIYAEKLSDNLKDLKINTQIDISSVNSIKGAMLGKGEDALKIDFNYNIDYNPSFAKISISGEIFLADTSDKVKEIVKNWNKNKEFDDNAKIFLFNIILRKCNIKALQLEDEMAFPLHLPLPSIKKEKQ